MNRVLLCVFATLLSIASARAQERAAPPASSPSRIAAAADVDGSGHRLLVAVAPIPSHAVSNVASGAVPQAAVRGLATGALPPPPTTVVLDTKTYGTVTLDHAAHLSRRISCKQCHLPGPVGKIEFTPKYAHDACRGCHQQIAKGPIDCRGCHVGKPETAVAAAEPEPAAAAGPAQAQAQAQAELPPASEALVALEPELSTPPPAFAYRRTALVGTSVLAGDGRAMPALSASVRMLEGGYVFSNTLDIGSGGRMLGLLGGGVVMPVRPRLAIHVLGVGGFDALKTVLLPTVGARVGVEMRTGVPWVPGVDVSLTAATDIGHGEGAAGQRVGGVIGAFAVSAGFDLRSGR